MSYLFSAQDDLSSDRLKALKDQEGGYSYGKYLSAGPDGVIHENLNVSWRERICQWSYNVVDQ